MPERTTFTVWFIVAGALLIGMALAASALRRAPVTASIFYLGAVRPWVPWGAGLLRVDAVEYASVLERLAETAVISLFTAGLTLRLPSSDRRSRAPMLRRPSRWCSQSPLVESPRLSHTRWNTMQRFLRWLRRVALVLLVTWLFACGVLAVIIHYTGTIDEAARSDVIVVLGAALTSEGRPNRALSRRSQHAAELWKGGHADVIICTGGIGPDVRIPRSEADGCREVLMREGVPQTAIVLEDTSRSTEENALNTRDIMAKHGWDSAILVSDSYHVFRARHIVRRMGISVVLSPVPVAKIGSPLFYVHAVVREVGALHWQVLK